MLVASVADFLRSFEILGAKIVVAVSGGPDSMALLQALRVLDYPLITAHLNHQLRGQESDEDEGFVRAFCARHGVTFISEKRDVRSLAKESGENLESVARDLRYAWLGEVARQNQARYVATGHSADDQAETLIHRLLRGTGLRGLRGIAPCRSLGDVTLIRPLIHVRRREVLAYLQSTDQDYRVDSSNLSLELTRNRIRQELLPLLEKEYNAAIVSILCGLAEQAEESFEVIEQAASKLLEHAERPRAGDLLILDRNVLEKEPLSFLCEMFRLLWERESWPMGRMSRKHWQELAQLAQGARPAVDLPGGVKARVAGRVVQIFRDS